jgi:uncharacterized protein YvpB
MRLSRRALLGGGVALALVGCAGPEEAARPALPVRGRVVLATTANRPVETPTDEVRQAERAAERAAGVEPPEWLRGQVVIPTSGEPPATPPPATNHAPTRAPDLRRLAVPYRSQLDGNPYAEANCGPTSMAMVLDYFGRHVPTRELRAIVNDLQGTWGVYDAGSTIESLAAIAERYGLRPLDLQVGKKLRRWSVEEVRRHLDGGHPIVPQLWYRGLPGRERRPYDGDHYVVMTGYGADEVIYNDPIDKDGPGAARRMTWAQLDKAWRNSDFPYAGFAISA